MNASYFSYCVFFEKKLLASKILEKSSQQFTNLFPLKNFPTYSKQILSLFIRMTLLSIFDGYCFNNEEFLPKKG